MEMKNDLPEVTRMQGLFYAGIYFACLALVSGLVMLAPQDSAITAFHLLVR